MESWSNNCRGPSKLSRGSSEQHFCGASLLLSSLPRSIPVVRIPYNLCGISSLSKVPSESPRSRLSGFRVMIQNISPHPLREVGEDPEGSVAPTPGKVGEAPEKSARSWGSRGGPREVGEVSERSGRSRRVRRGRG